MSSLEVHRSVYRSDVSAIRRAAAVTTTYRNVPTQTVEVGGRRLAYRRLGPDSGVPVIFLNHLAAVLDNWDPRVVDGIAAKHPVITFDGPGVGCIAGHGARQRSPKWPGMPSPSSAPWASPRWTSSDSRWGASSPRRSCVSGRPWSARLILAGTGPAGGEGIDKVTRVTISDSVGRRWCARTRRRTSSSPRRRTARPRGVASSNA